ncbi:MAG: response regulator [Jatrophihabitantaceae bacterium]
MANVLVVDDDEANRDLVVTLLSYSAHNVSTAVNGADALAAARSNRPDLIITDLLMPVMDGYELTREIRADADLAAIPVIFSTANYLDEEIRPIASALGVRQIVFKPIDPSRLLSTVTSALTSDAPLIPVPAETFHREHQRAVNGKLVDKVRELGQAEAALHASEARFRALSEHSPIGIFSLTANGDLFYANPRLVQICDAGPDLTGVRWSDLIHPDDCARLQTAMAQASESGSHCAERVRLAPTDGPQRWVHLLAARVAHQVEDIVLVGSVEDITAAVDVARQREEAEKRRHVSERFESLGELAAGIAHDFNNVLSTIMTYNEFVEADLREADGCLDPAARSRLLENTSAIRSGAERAANLTRRLLVFARRGESHSELVDVNTTARDVFTLLSRTIGARVQIVDRLDSQPHVVLADRAQLEQVIVNLIINARDAIAQQGEVVVTSAHVTSTAAGVTANGGLPLGDYTDLTVTDNGCGMSPEVLSRVYEPFFTTKQSSFGTGLGLATVHAIATSLGGDVAISSVPGRGTSVHVYLPLASGGPGR